MGDIPIDVWNRMTLEERVEACYDHYHALLLEYQRVAQIVNVNDYITIKTILGVLSNIRGIS